MSPRSDVPAIVMVAVSLHPSSAAAQSSPGPLTIASGGTSVRFESEEDLAVVTLSAGQVYSVSFSVR